ncbi:MAG: transcriptional repressor LexA [Silvanigrellaceae bacterium]|nr:transcriptional repressor LexA [Silvanigrellaceae bacterium]
MVELTETQRKVMIFILEYMGTHGTPPTLREISEKFKWKAVGSAQDVVHALRKKGLLLSPSPGKSRQLVPCQKAYQILSPKSDSSFQAFPRTEEALRVPILGIIQAGNPSEAIENAGEFINLPFFPGAKQQAHANLFALSIEGYSMLNAGFLPGDLILVETSSQAKDRDIIVASVENHEVTVKRFAQKGSALFRNHIEQLKLKHGKTFSPPALLVAENPDFEPIPFGLSCEDKIVGKVFSLFRKDVI